jgi:uncharacterized membrane protein
MNGMALTLAYVLHLLGAVLWVGGMGFAIMVLRPSLGVLPVPQRLALHSGVFRRFFLVVWHAVPVMLVTGYLMLFGWFGGFAGAGWHVHVMHLTGLIMSGIFLFVFFGPWKRMRLALTAEDNPAAAAAADAIRKLILLNLILGLVTVAVAAWGRAGG